MDKFTYLGSNNSLTKNEINMRLANAWTAIDKLSMMWKTGIFDKIKRNFFQAAVVSIILYGCTTWMLTKRIEKNCTRQEMLQGILNESLKQYVTEKELHGHLPPISKTIQIRRTKHAGHCWRSKEEQKLHSPLDPFTKTCKNLYIYNCQNILQYCYIYVYIYIYIYMYVYI